MAINSNKPFMFGNTLRPKLNRSGKIVWLAIKLTLLNSNFDVIGDQRVTLMCSSKKVWSCATVHQNRIILVVKENSIKQSKLLNYFLYILRKTVEGYLDSVPSLTFNTIITKLIMHAFHSSRYLQSKWMFDLSHASIIKVQYMSKWRNPLYWKVKNIQKWLKPF